MEELLSKYKRRELTGNMLGVVAFGVVGVAYYLLFQFAADWCCRDLKDVRYLIRLEPILVGAFAGMLSLFSSTYFLHFLLRWFVGRVEYAVYMEYASRKMDAGAPIDLTKLFKWMFLLFFTPLFLFAVLLVDSFTAFTDQMIIDNPVWTLGIRVERPYTDVRGVYEVGGFHARFEDIMEPSHVIVFADGSRWETERKGEGPLLERHREIMRFVAEQNGRQVMKVDFVEELPP